uniref:Uncharacterized protein n=1 Tax=Oryza glumipatula TaxID=40148 RepID=A0A0D9ZUK3_9ORYZ
MRAPAGIGVGGRPRTTSAGGTREASAGGTGRPAPCQPGRPAPGLLHRQHGRPAPSLLGRLVLGGHRQPAPAARTGSSRPRWHRQAAPRRARAATPWMVRADSPACDELNNWINLIGNRTKMRKDVKCWNFEMIVDSDRTCFMDFVQSIKIPLYHGRMKLQLLLCPFHHQGLLSLSFLYLYCNNGVPSSFSLVVKPWRVRLVQRENIVTLILKFPKGTSTIDVT